jgi:precorrin-2/cobalt-factor-2 C20-methyltransferase
MRKSSVYLPDDLKAELHALSTRWGRSEAELIRLAIERLVRSGSSEAAPTRVVEAPQGPCLIGVGIGPSDPDLVTERALAVLRSADRVYAPSTSTDAISRAEVVVRAAAPEVPVDRLVIDIGSDEGSRSASIDAWTRELIGQLDQGRVVAVVVLGDPNVYSVFSRVARLVQAERPELPITTVPGVMGFQDLAARTGTVLAEGDEQLSVLALGREADPLAALLGDDGRTVVVYKGGRHVPEVAAMVARADREEGAVMGELLGLPGERAAPLAEVGERPASYLATMVIPARRTEGEAS